MRIFDPAFYTEILRPMGVSTVVRLNEPRYEAEALTSQGFAHHSLNSQTAPARPTPLRPLSGATAPGVLAAQVSGGMLRRSAKEWKTC
jgi:hypothetical protein